MKETILKVFFVILASLAITFLLFVLVGNVMNASTNEDNTMALAIVISVQLSFLTGLILFRAKK